jgi:HEPN domain-containing protein
LPGSAEEWLTHARSDLKLARIARKDEDVLVEQVCFHAPGDLTPYAVETRYPGYWDEINEADVDVALNLAEQVLTWAEKHITF